MPLLAALLSGVFLGSACTCLGEEADASDGQTDHANKTRRPVIAVIQPKGGELTLLTALLEERLSRNDRCILVDREHIDKVVKEQELGMLSAASSVSERMALSRLLGADLLVLLSKHTSPKPHCGIVISETSRGLRLQVSKLPTTDEPEKDSQAIQREIENALKKKAEPFTSIWAVPPFLSADLTRRHDHLQAAYSRLIEQMLLKTKGMVVVELAEARAIAREMQLSGRPDGPKRKLPLYVLGEYRHSGNGKDRKVAVSLTVKRGETVLGRLERSELAPAAVPAFLRESTQQLVTKATGQKMPAADPVAEARLLAERAETFRRIGNWTEALALYEASLLLDPDREAVRRGIVLTLEQLTRSCYEWTRTGPKYTLENATEGLNYHRLGLTHVEWLMRFGKCGHGSQENQDEWYWLFSKFFSSSLWWKHATEQIEALYDQILIEGREMFLRVLEYRMRKGNLTWPIVEPASRHFFHHSENIYREGKQYEQSVAMRLRAIRIIADHPKARIWVQSLVPSLPYAWQPEIGHKKYRALLEEISRIPGKGVQEAVAILRQRYQDQLAKATPPRKAYPHFGEDEDQAEVDIIIRRLSAESGANLTGWLSCGKGIDAAWSHTEMHLMKQPGKLKSVFLAKEDRHNFKFAGVTYDGKYLWAPVARGSYHDSRDGLLLVIDPQSEEVWQITSEDGLPSMSRGAVATALEPGTVCLAGAFERGWVAVVKFDPARGKSIKMIHEARIQPDKNKDRYTLTHAPGVAFRPKFMFTLPQRGGLRPSRILLGRYNSDLRGMAPCIIDLAKKSLAFSPEEGSSVSSHLPFDLTVHDGAFHWVSTTADIFKSDKETRVQLHVDVHRMRLADMKKETVLKRFTPPGEWHRPRIFFHGGKIHIVGSQWWSSEDFNEPFVRMKTKCIGWQKPGNSDAPGLSLPFRRFWLSEHYGLLLVAPRVGVFRVEFQNKQKSPALNRPSAASPAEAPGESLTPTVAIIVQVGAQPLGDLLAAQMLESLQREGGIHVVERERVKAAIAELGLSMAGLVRNPLQAGKLIGAEVLVSIDGRQYPTTGMLNIQAIDVATGGVVGETVLHFAPSKTVDESATRKVLKMTRQSLLRRSAESERPTATVLFVQNTGKTRRVDFLAHTLRETCEQLLVARGFSLLRRRRADLARHETRLNTTGMVRPEARVLAQAADVVVTLQYGEKPTGKTEFAETPIAVDIVVRRQARQERRQHAMFTLNSIAELRESIRVAFDAMIDMDLQPATQAAKVDDQMAARFEAARLMASTHPTVQLDLDKELRTQLETYRTQAEMLQRVLYLDPGLREAYFRLGATLNEIVDYSDVMEDRMRHERAVDKSGILTPQKRLALRREASEAMMAYVQFPEFGPKDKMWRAYQMLLWNYDPRGEDQWDEGMQWMAEMVRWVGHAHPDWGPVYQPAGHNSAIKEWWKRHPQKRVAWHRWVIGQCANRSTVGETWEYIRLAEVLDDMGRSQDAAKVFYDAFVTSKPSTVAVGRSMLWKSSRNYFPDAWTRLSRHLTPEQAKEVQARFDEVTELLQRRQHPLISRGQADAQILKRMREPMTRVTPIRLPVTLCHSVLIRRTAAGLWLQGITPEKKLALLHLPKEGTWQVAPPMVGDLKQVPRFIDVAQSEHEVVFAASGGIDSDTQALDGRPLQGLFVLNLETRQWRRYDQRAGLPANDVVALYGDPANRGVWVLTGDGSVSRYRQGNFFLSNVKAPVGADTLGVRGGRIVFGTFKSRFSMHSVPMDSKLGVRADVRLGDLRQHIPVPRPYEVPNRGYWNEYDCVRGIAVLEEHTYFVSPLGIGCMDPAGELKRVWYGTGFVGRNDLDGVVEGNSPLPPCGLQEIVPDDKEPHLVWLVSHHNLSGSLQFGYRLATAMALRKRPPKEDVWTSCWITAFNTNTGSFSAARCINRKAVHIEPYGNLLYLAGRHVAAVSKKHWLIDTPVRPNPISTRSDTPLDATLKLWKEPNKELKATR